MSTIFKPYKQESRSNWGRKMLPSQVPTNDELQLGAVLRIADAAELMAKSYADLESDRDNYRKWYLEQRQQNARAWRSNCALRGQITKLKKKLEAFTGGTK